MDERTSHKVSNRVNLTLPPIMQVVKNLARGRDVINMSQGVPFFNPPKDSIDSALENIDDLHRYGPDGGDPELKEEISRKLSMQNGIQADPEDGIMVTSGANLGFFNAATAICDVGDEMILLDPFYFNHQMSMDVLGIKAKHIPTDENYLPDPDLVDRSIGHKTKAIILVSPNNPTGMSYPRPILNDILDVCNEHDIILISDETYEGFEYETNHISPSSIDPSVNSISLFSFSKNYSLSGWRIGYMVYPPELHDSLLKVQDTTVICPSRISQKVALHCLRDHPSYLSNFLPELDRSRKEVIKWLRSNGSVLSCPEPDGAYYALPSLISDKAPKDSMELVKDILDRTGVLLVPGTPFGRFEPPHFRIAYGNVSREQLLIALEKMDEYLKQF